MSYMNEGLAFIDTETTGLDDSIHPIWEVAVIVDGEEHCWQQKLNVWAPDDVVEAEVWTPPGARRGLPISDTGQWGRLPTVSPWSLENGLADRYNHVDALAPADSIRRFAELTAGRAIIGSNPSFDMTRLGLLHDRYIGGRHPWDYHLIDIRSAVVPRALDYHRRISDARDEPYGETPSPRWSTARLSEMIGVDPPETGHTALGDARWVKEMWETVMA